MAFVLCLSILYGTLPLGKKMKNILFGARTIYCKFPTGKKGSENDSVTETLHLVKTMKKSHPQNRLVLVYSFKSFDVSQRICRCSAL